MTHASGEMAEWSIAAVLKTVEGNTSGGSNPSLSAENESSNTKILNYQLVKDFFLLYHIASGLYLAQRKK